MSSALISQFDVLARRVGVQPLHVAVRELSPGHRGLFCTDAVAAGTRLLVVPSHTVICAPRNANRDSVFDDLTALTQVVRNRMGDVAHRGAVGPAEAHPRLYGSLETTEAMADLDKYILAWLLLMPLPEDLSHPALLRPTPTSSSPSPSSSSSSTSSSSSPFSSTLCSPFTAAALRCSAELTLAAAAAAAPDLGVPAAEGRAVAESVYNTFEAELRSRTTDVALARMVLSRMDALPHPRTWPDVAAAHERHHDDGAGGGSGSGRGNGGGGGGGGDGDGTDGGGGGVEEERRGEDVWGRRIVEAPGETAACMLLPYYDMINGATDGTAAQQNVALAVEEVETPLRRTSCAVLRAARDLRAGEEAVLEYDRGEAFAGHPAPVGPMAARVWPAYRFAMPELVTAKLW